MSMLISFVLADSNCEPRKESQEFQNEKFLPTAGFEPTISPLLDWCSNLLCYRVVLTVDFITKKLNETIIIR